MSTNLVTLHAAAAMFKSGRNTLRARLHNGTLPFTRNDEGHYLVDPADVERVLSYRRTSKKPATAKNLRLMEQLIGLVETTDEPALALMDRIGLVRSIPGSWRSGKNCNDATRAMVVRLDAAMAAREERQREKREAEEQRWLDAISQHGNVKDACKALGISRYLLYNACGQSDPDRAAWFKAEMERRMKEAADAVRLHKRAAREDRAASRVPTGRVYIIGEDGGGPVKIGYTSYDPESRLRGLATGNAKRLVVLAVGAGSIGTERELHGIMRPFRLEGEWFAPTPPVRTLIRAMNQRGAGAPLDAAFLDDVRKMVESFVQPKPAGGLFGQAQATQ